MKEKGGGKKKKGRWGSGKDNGESHPKNHDKFIQRPLSGNGYL